MPPPPLPPAFRQLTPLAASPAPAEPEEALAGQAAMGNAPPAAEDTQEKPAAPKKPKRVRLLLDQVTELSDEELKVCLSFPRPTPATL